ncbi:glycoside hydrolase family 5 protein [Amanita thiersii Skay4041]|uniref:glucan 1,3-beta-glucosidase n=1 Tax=Amanita thiersii Skay4041 TaxID=703135 RepID=A0A2A9NQB4_9AGAR|nr:glycoside hydrolase family 5 protein [Amanita thiersii Skay4041]
MVVLLIVVIVMPAVYLAVIKPNEDSVDPDHQKQSENNGSNETDGNTTGDDGSIVIMEDGTRFVYENKFEGFWVSDPKNPFNNNAQPNYWTRPMNQRWNWGKDRSMVSTSEAFLFSNLSSYQHFTKNALALSLSVAMAADTANGGLNQLEEHYKSFIQDIAQIAGAGLNWICLHIPYWAMKHGPESLSWREHVGSEISLPALTEETLKCDRYILRLLGWARKYELCVKLDLHTIPGSQNGYNHSGKGGQITEFISQAEYQQFIPVFGVVNEPFLKVIGRSQLSSFYLEVHDIMRNITGYGEGNNPFISIHDGFEGTTTWTDFLPGSDRISSGRGRALLFDQIGNSTSNRVRATLLSHKFGLKNGWIPTDPREAVGTCKAYGVSGPDFDGNLKRWRTGGIGARTIVPAVAEMFPWPPVSFESLDAPVRDLPTYTPTGPIATLPPPTFTLPGQDQSQYGGNG